MALEKTFENLINERKITRDRVSSLEVQIADVCQRADQEFKDLSSEVRSELGDVLEQGIIGYAKNLIYFGHETGRMLGQSIPHLDSNLFDLARRYIAKNGQETMFGIKLIFVDVWVFPKETHILKAITEKEMQEL